jgi:predicted nucleotidyltransferase
MPLSRDQILETLQAHRNFLAAEYGVHRIGLFGSYAKNDPHDGSDIDLVAELDRPLGLKFIELTEYLEGLFGKKVDVLTPAGILSIRNKELAREIRESVVYA